MKKFNLPKDFSGYSTDMFCLGIQVRNLYEKIKDKIKILVSKK